MIARDHPRLSIVRQCALVGISRSSYYYQGKGESAFNLKLMRLIDEQWLKTPFFGSRRMARYLGREGVQPEPEKGSAFDEKDGPSSGISPASYQRPPPGAPGLSLFAQRSVMAPWLLHKIRLLFSPAPGFDSRAPDVAVRCCSSGSR